MRLLAGVFALVLTVASPRAAELVMFEQRGCVWCQRFDREVAPAYQKTTEGKRAPLRRVDIGKPRPPDLAFIQRERFTPVFVLVDNGREVGRIRGYPGDAFFYGLLANLIAQMDRGESTPPDPSAPPPPGATFGE
jgi:thioredoxin-related protein